MKRLVALAAALAAVAVAGAGGTYVSCRGAGVGCSNSYLFLPDPARPVDPLVSVRGERRRERGGVYMVDILVRKATLVERVFPGLVDGASLVPAHAVNPVGVSEQERRRESLHEMSRSQEIAVAVALRSLGRHVRVDRTGAEVVTVFPGTPAAGALEVGDVIAEANDHRVRSPEELREAMGEVRPGDDVELEIRRGEKRTTLRLATIATDRDRRAVVGVGVQQAAEFDFPVDVDIDAGDVGGPSAGLAFALDVVDEVGPPDVDDGRRIVVTGELELDGDVLAIGGIKQKTIGAREAGADLFVVPEANAREARKYAGGLEILAVTTFDDALSHLTK
ncbi:MAG: PDZ domain-containing protein [Thermoleophilia bacterium]|nr:PDZ domain-containing protein [Thermoleophilia bacterium]